MKVCRKCGRDFSGKNCDHCARDRVRAWKAANPERSSESQAAYRAANKEKIAKAKAEYHKANAEKIRAKASAWVKENPERAAETHRAYAEKNAEKIAQYQAAYRVARSEELKAYRQTYYVRYVAENRDKIRARARAYHKANPERARISNHTRRAMKDAVGGKLSVGLSDKLFGKQKGKCACCGKALGDDYHLDHIMPIALGGSNTDDNIQLLRAECNLSKGYKHPVEFMQSKGYLL